MLEPIGRFIHRIGRLVLLDRAADPTANGELQRNATHVKVYSGGAVRNLSDVGAAPAHTLASHSTKAHSELTGVGTGDHHAESHTHASHTGIGTGDHHTQLHATAHQPGGGDAMAVDAAAATGSLRTLGAGAAQAATGNHTHAGGGAETSAQADVAAWESTTSTAYTDLTTAGPAVTLSPGSTQNHLIWTSVQLYSNDAVYGAFMSVTIAGAAAVDADAVQGETGNSTWTTPCRPIYAASVASGSTHTCKYKSENVAATANFQRRRIVATTTG